MCISNWYQKKSRVKWIPVVLPAPVTLADALLSVLSLNLSPKGICCYPKPGLAKIKSGGGEIGGKLSMGPSQVRDKKSIENSTEIWGRAPTSTSWLVGNIYRLGYKAPVV